MSEIKEMNAKAKDEDFEVYIYGLFEEDETPQQYADKLLEWANIWDYEAVKEEIRKGNMYHIEFNDSHKALVHSLDLDDLKGLFGNAYSDSLPALKTFKSEEYHSFSANVWIFLDDEEYENIKNEYEGICSTS